MSRTTIRLRPDLMEGVKAYARTHNTTFTDVVETAMERFLNARETAKEKTPANLPTSGGGGIVDGLTYEEAVARAQLEADKEKLRLKHVPA